MNKIVRAARGARVRLVPPTQEGNRAAPVAMLTVLVLFVVWLLATGQGLLPAISAALILSIAADRATRTREAQA